VDAGAELDAVDQDHNATALQYLIGDEGIASLLIDRGASADVFATSWDWPILREWSAGGNSTHFRRRSLAVSLVVAHRRNLSRRVRAFMKWIENVLAPYLE
jgi:hypothetical protein